MSAAARERSRSPAPEFVCISRANIKLENYTRLATIPLVTGCFRQHPRTVQTRPDPTSRFHFSPTVACIHRCHRPWTRHDAIYRLVTKSSLLPTTTSVRASTQFPSPIHPSPSDIHPCSNFDHENFIANLLQSNRAVRNAHAAVRALNIELAASRSPPTIRVQPHIPPPPPLTRSPPVRQFAPPCPTKTSRVSACNFSATPYAQSPNRTRARRRRPHRCWTRSRTP